MHQLLVQVCSEQWHHFLHPLRLTHCWCSCGHLALSFRNHWQGVAPHACVYMLADLSYCVLVVRSSLGWSLPSVSPVWTLAGSPMTGSPARRSGPSLLTPPTGELPSLAALISGNVCAALSRCWEHYQAAQRASLPLVYHPCEGLALEPSSL